MYATRLLDLAEEAYVYCPEELPIIEKQLIGYFTDGLAHGYLRLKVMRDNPPTFQAAVNVAMAEQTLRTRYNLRAGENVTTYQNAVGHQHNQGHQTVSGHLNNLRQQFVNGPEPMEIDHLRPQKSCSYCKKLGHVIRDCRKRLRKINAVGQEQIRPDRRLTTGTWKAKVECWSCGKLGHVSRDCRSSRNRQFVRRNFQQQGN